METKGECGADIRQRKPDSRNSETQECDSRNSPLRVKSLRACLETTRALRRGILAVAKAALAARSAPQRAVRNEPTPATDKRPAARRVFAEKAVSLRPARECFRSCSVVAARSASFVAPRHPAFSPKTAPLVVSKQALSRARVTLDTRESCEMHEMVKTRSRRFGASVNRPNPTTSTQARGRIKVN